MDVVVVRDGNELRASLLVEQDLIRGRRRRACRRAGRRGPTSVRNRSRSAGRTASTSRNSKYGIVSDVALAQLRAVFDAGHARCRSRRARPTGSIDAHATCTNCGRRPSPRAIMSAISTSKPRTRDGSAASASTNGAPPSASPPQRSGALAPLGRRRGNRREQDRAECRRAAERRGHRGNRKVGLRRMGRRISQPLQLAPAC